MLVALRRVGWSAPSISSKRRRRPYSGIFAAAGAALILGSAPAHGSALSSGLELIENNYLFASELDGPRLLRNALSYLEARLPEVRVLDAKDGGHVLVAGPCRLRLEAPPGEHVTDLEPALRKAESLIDDCISERPADLPPTEALLLNGVLSGLDPYSLVFDADGKMEHTIQFEGALAGIGARIGIRDDKLTLVNVYAGSPAARAGLIDGDVVGRIDGASTTNLPVNDAVAHIRGEIGSTVRLEIERNGTEDPFTVAVSRDLVTIPSVEVSRLPHGIVYAAISHFSQTTPWDFRSHVEAAVSAGGVKGIIIDLRANSGGSMLGSAAIADLFLDEGVLITTAGRNGSRVPGLTAEIRATPDTPFGDYPLAILTSPRTASGSELLAASLRTHDRAILVGERTFGKGTVQKTYALENDCSLKMTVGNFLPNGLAIPGGGLAPDVQFRSFTFTKHALALPDDRESSELPFWLRTPPWLTSAVIEPRAELTYATKGDGEDGLAEPSATDPVVDFSASMLTRFGSTSVEHMLSDASGWLVEQRAEADAELESTLAAQGIDWVKPTAVATVKGVFSPSLRIRVAPKGGTLVAGQEGKLAVTVTNTGSTDLYRVQGRLTSEARFLDGYGLLFGHLGAGETRKWDLDVEPPAAVRTSRYPVRVALRGEHGPLIESGAMYLAVDGAAQPRLAHRVAVLPGTEPGTLRLRVEVRNLGEGAAEGVRAFLKHPDTDAVELVQGTAKLERLEPGQTQNLELEARMVESEKTPVTLVLVLAEDKFRTFFETKVELTPRAAFGAWDEAPRIRISRLVREAGDGAYKVIAEAVDDKGLTTVWCTVGNKKIDYIDAHDEPKRKLHVDLPWHPSADAQRVEIIATDSDGMTTTYVTDL